MKDCCGGPDGNLGAPSLHRGASLHVLRIFMLFLSGF
jgi:hypothetical protein